MKTRLLLMMSCLMLSSIVVNAQNNSVSSAENPLASYSPLWNQQKFMDCNTGATIKYFSKKEKEVIWILNMLRLDPQLFLETVLLNQTNPEYMEPGKRDENYLSLMADLKKLKPANKMLIPDYAAYQSAYCHAVLSGKTGYVGHDRRGSCKADFYGECCDYGNEDPLQALLDLLIDRYVASLGHRYICLSPNYNSIGVSIQPHKGYGVNYVLDFK